MANMSYCRFENTSNDLADCEEWLSENDPKELSEAEQRAFRRLVKSCYAIASDYGENVLGFDPFED